MAGTSEKQSSISFWAPLLAAAVGLVTFLVYLPALQNGFVEWWDDQW